MAAAPDTVHATCIALEGRAVLLTGRSGVGKSDLALRCLALGPPLLPGPVMLVADDRVRLRLEQGRLMASCPPAIAGRLEVRGLGILTFDSVETAEVALIVKLDQEHYVERLPASWPTVDLLGISVPELTLRAFEASAALKVMLALVHCKVAGLP